MTRNDTRAVGKDVGIEVLTSNAERAVGNIVVFTASVGTGVGRKVGIEALAVGDQTGVGANVGALHVQLHDIEEFLEEFVEFVKFVGAIVGEIVEGANDGALLYVG